MGKIIAGLMCVILLCFSGMPASTERGGERPVANVPVELRQLNWLGHANEGSCTWASCITALNWEGQYAQAEWVRANCGDGQTPNSLAKGMVEAGIEFAWTYGEADVQFLDEAVATRRAAMVAVMEGEHMVTLVHLDATTACVVDNNNPRVNQWMSREAFLHEWIQAGSWAVVPKYPPVPPLVP